MLLRDALNENERQAVLTTLGEANGYRLNESVLRSALTSMALPLGRDQVRGHLTWLETNNLVEVERMPTQTTGELWIATLTDLGDQVRQGQSYPGVKRAGLR